MPAYFNCSLCHRISVMHQLRARCPECGSRSGEFSCERPRGTERHHPEGPGAAPGGPASGRPSRRARYYRLRPQAVGSE